MYSDFHFYIDFNWADAVNKQIDTFIKELYQLVELARQHKSTIYYSEKQLQDFVRNIDDLDNNFSVSYGNQLNLIVENAINETKMNYAFEVCFAEDNTSFKFINSIYSIVNQNNKVSIISL